LRPDSVETDSVRSYEKSTKFIKNMAAQMLNGFMLTSSVELYNFIRTSSKESHAIARIGPRDAEIIAKRYSEKA